MEYVILDIETTGLDLEHSSIIEVGAILVEKNTVRQKFSSLVHYEGDLPQAIKHITGITEKMLRDAPALSEILPKLTDFISNRPVVSHNGLLFDFPILERVGIKFSEKYDSMDFAFFVLPTNINGHSISVLSQQFGLGEIPHRALKDCELEFSIIKNLQKEYQKRNKKKQEALKYVIELGRWWWSNFLPSAAKKPDFVYNLVDDYVPYRKETSEQEVLSFQTKKIDLNEVNRYFQSTQLETGVSSEMDYSEDRPEQRKMAATVATAFNEQKHAVIEAGTGTGKSKAYLVPSILFALRNSIPIIISTHTKALQDQLFYKEILHIKDIINPDLRVAILKGKKNYVCLQKFEEFSDRIISSLSQRSLNESWKSTSKYPMSVAYFLLLSWVIETNRGDWDELPYWIKEGIPKEIEGEICNLDELCTSKTCELYDTKKCFLAKARAGAKDADLVIVNHALTLSGIVAETVFIKPDEDELGAGVLTKHYDHTVLPNEAKFIVFDEAHHLEDDATSAWEYVISRSKIHLLLQQLYGKRGIVAMAKSVANENEKKSDRLLSLVDSFAAKEGDLKLLIDSIFDIILPQLVSENEAGVPCSYSMLDEIPNTLPVKGQLLESLKELQSKLANIRDTLETLSNEATSEKVSKILFIRSGSIQPVIKALGVILANEGEYVNYLERSGSNIEVKAAPLSVAEILKEQVYDNYHSAILTSATLTVNRNFNFFASRCGTDLVTQEKINYKLFKSSFDYAKQVKFFVPKGIIYDGNSQAHFEQCVAFLERAIIASGGGALVLCSSHAQVGQLYERLLQPLSQNNIWLLHQSKEMSVSSVVRDFKKDVNSVLVGTETLWQGIDVPGESLRSLFIYKIPYRMPSLPIIKARRAALDLNGEDSFGGYYEPLAAILLKQGFGRLIRKATDRGVVVLLDEKFLHKPRLINSLPEGVYPLAVNPEVIYDCLRSSTGSEIKA